VLIIPRIKVKDGKFKIPISNAFKRDFGEITIDLDDRLDPAKIKEVRIHPKYDARFFEVEYISLCEIEAVIEMAIASFLDTEALGFADCKPGRGQ
jgi:putative transposase